MLIILMLFYFFKDTKPLRKLMLNTLEKEINKLIVNYSERKYENEFLTFIG